MTSRWCVVSKLTTTPSGGRSDQDVARASSRHAIVSSDVDRTAQAFVLQVRFCSSSRSLASNRQQQHQEQQQQQTDTQVLRDQRYQTQANAYQQHLQQQLRLELHQRPQQTCTEAQKQRNDEIIGARMIYSHNSQQNSEGGDLPSSHGWQVGAQRRSSAPDISE